MQCGEIAQLGPDAARDGALHRGGEHRGAGDERPDGVRALRGESVQDQRLQTRSIAYALWREGRNVSNINGKTQQYIAMEKYAENIKLKAGFYQEMSIN